MHVGAVNLGMSSARLLFFSLSGGVLKIDFLLERGNFNCFSVA